MTTNVQSVFIGCYFYLPEDSDKLRKEQALLEEAADKFLKCVESGRRVESSLDKLARMLELSLLVYRDYEASERKVKSMEFIKSIDRLARKANAEGKTGKRFHADIMTRLAIFKTDSNLFNNHMDEFDSLKEAETLLKSQNDDSRDFDFYLVKNIARRYIEIGKREEACELLKWLESSVKSFCIKNSREQELATELMKLFKLFEDCNKDEASRLLQEAASCCKSYELDKSAVWDATTLRDIGHGLATMGKFEEAFELLKNWEIYSEWQKDGYQLGIKSIVAAYIKINKPDQALRLINEHVSAIGQMKQYKSEPKRLHITVAESFTDYAAMLIEAKKFDEAYELLKDAECHHKSWCLKNSLSPFASTLSAEISL